MKRLLRCCRQHDEQYILHALGLFFAYRGRTYNTYLRAAPSPLARAYVKGKLLNGVRLWVTQATQNLCVDAQKRIRKEITAHCQDALESLEELGLLLEEAETRVLEELGDPTVANRAFQKTYLTPAQERYVARISSPSPTYYQTLGMAMVFACVCASLEALFFLSRNLGWFDVSTPGNIMMAFMTMCLLFQVRFRFRFEIYATRKWEFWFKARLVHARSWILFALLTCLYGYMEAKMRPQKYFFCCIFIVVLPLYWSIHRGIIRDIFVSFPRSPRARTCLMLGYSSFVFGLMLAVILLFRWTVQVGREDYEPEVGFIYQAIPTVVALFWFGCHALVGAYFVSKCNVPQTKAVEREPQEEDPA